MTVILRAAKNWTNCDSPVRCWPPPPYRAERLDGPRVSGAVERQVQAETLRFTQGAT
ncbi:MAG TPA: hypothetical protein VNN62_10405 [Methylomirabilota bacterium]|jgi:hypothetical protein|nr:hypothetical protein [Methylomirabilota bacterium]